MVYLSICSSCTSSAFRTRVKRGRTPTCDVSAERRPFVVHGKEDASLSFAHTLVDRFRCPMSRVWNVARRWISACTLIECSPVS